MQFFPGLKNTAPNSPKMSFHAKSLFFFSGSVHSPRRLLWWTPLLAYNNRRSASVFPGIPAGFTSMRSVYDCETSCGWECSRRPVTARGLKREISTRLCSSVEYYFCHKSQGQGGQEHCQDPGHRFDLENQLISLSSCSLVQAVFQMNLHRKWK